jgi:hypothetical protein
MTKGDQQKVEMDAWLILGAEVAASLAQTSGFEYVLTSAGPVPVRTWAGFRPAPWLVALVVDEAGQPVAFEELGRDGRPVDVAGRWPLVPPKICGEVHAPGRLNQEARGRVSEPGLPAFSNSWD